MTDARNARLAVIAAAVACPAAAIAGPVLPEWVTSPDELVWNEGPGVDARFRADTTNWDTRLAYDSTPSAGDLTGAVSNTRSAFEGGSFAFSLFHDASAGTVRWEVSRDGVVRSALTLSTAGVGALNTATIAVTGSRGGVSLSGVQATDTLDTTIDFPAMTASPTGTTHASNTYFFGNGFDLTALSWTLRGVVAFDAFDRSNPSEGAKLSISLGSAQTVSVPGPGVFGVVAMAGVVAMRRRR